MRRSKYFTTVALAALLLSACSSAVAPTATHTPTQEQSPPTERPVASVPTNTPTMPPKTATSPPETATATQEPRMATPTQEPETATATQKPQPATATPAPVVAQSFLDVRPGEWVHGPPDAPVTIVEYADFQ